MEVAHWLNRVLIGLDQLLNALAGGGADETISSRAGRSRSRFGRAFAKVLSIFERDHGLKALEYTPWGTADPHHLAPVRHDLAADWAVLLEVMRRPEATFDDSLMDAAARAYARLRVWQRANWSARMAQDLKAGDKLQV